MTNDNIYFDKEEIKQYELTIEKALKLIKEEYKKPQIIIYEDKEVEVDKE